MRWNFAWPLLLLCIVAQGATVWATIKDGWSWIITTVLAGALLLSVLGTFEGC